MQNLDIIHLGDAKEILSSLPEKSVDCCVTSPPYYALRDYGIEGQLGLESTPEEYISKLADIFDEVHRVLKDDGTLWVNIGDSYNGNKLGNTNAKWKSTNTESFEKKIWSGAKPKDLIGIPFMLAFELRKRGWYLRQDIIWNKTNAMPESVTDRCTKSHEYIFLLSKSQKYYFDYKAIQEKSITQDLKGAVRFGGNKYGNNTDRHYQSYSGNEWKPKTKNCQYNGQTPNSFHVNRELGNPDKKYFVRNKRSVWSISTEPSKESHIAMYPTKLVVPCVLAGCRRGGGSVRPIYGKRNYCTCSKAVGTALYRCRIKSRIQKDSRQTYLGGWCKFI